MTVLDQLLSGYDPARWRQVVDGLLPDIHEVDRTATDIWFHVYPLELARVLDEADDPDALTRQLVLQGRWSLRDQIDSSHLFLYGHRYWPEVKDAVSRCSIGDSAAGPLQRLIRTVAQDAAGRAGVDASLTLGITAVAFMTLAQVGSVLFSSAPGRCLLPPDVVRRSPAAVLRARARNDSQGLLGFLKGEKKTYTVTFDESSRERRFPLIRSQELATAAAYDTRDYHSRDPRCIPKEGPIPVECRAASCGTCWVGVLGGADRLAPVGRREEQRMREFGYIETDHPRPIIRLACQAQAFGAVSIVIPPWNGVFGKVLRQRRAP